MPPCSPASIAVLLHLSSTRTWPDFKAALQNLAQPFDLYVNLVLGLNTSDELDRQSHLIHRHYPNAHIVRSSNRGMDVGGMFRLFDLALTGPYKAVLYAHSKSDDAWRHQLITTLTHNSTQIIDTLTSVSLEQTRPIGMIGAYAYPFDYYNLGPYLDILKQLGIEIDSSWSRYFLHYPAIRKVPIEQRIAHALECSMSELRPELDIEYAQTMLGDPHVNEQAMNPMMLRRFIADRVVTALPYFPGNFFWISMPLIRNLRTLVDFEHERTLLPVDLCSDLNFQSRAHAWERALPVFVAKNGYRLYSLKTQSRV